MNAKYWPCSLVTLASKSSFFVQSSRSQPITLRFSRAPHERTKRRRIERLGSAAKLVHADRRVQIPWVSMLIPSAPRPGAKS
jgi:hypothetical protein